MLFSCIVTPKDKFNGYENKWAFMDIGRYIYIPNTKQRKLIVLFFITAVFWNFQIPVALATG